MEANRSAKKRALLIRNAFSYDFGGGERFPIYLAQELEKNGWEAIIITAHHKILRLASQKNITTVKGWWWSRQDWSGAKILLTPAYLAWQLVLFCWYVQLFIRLKPDVIHPQSKDDFIAATLAGRLLGKRVIWTDHADLKYVYQNVTVPYKNLTGKLVKLCSRFAYAITLVSQSELSLIRNALHTKTLHSRYLVVYNGITEFTPPKIKRDPKDREVLVFCATSRLVAAKGIGELIDAFKQANSKGDMRLWLLGEGPDELKFKSLAANNPHISFLGFPDNSYSILQNADIFVHPSHHEGFSLSLIEAAMLSKPIIACNVGGNPEIITDGTNGILVPPKNTDALLRAMQKLASNPKLRTQFAQAARQTFERHFRFDTIVKKEFITLYEK